MKQLDGRRRQASPGHLLAGELGQQPGRRRVKRVGLGQYRMAGSDGGREAGAAEGVEPEREVVRAERGDHTGDRGLRVRALKRRCDRRRGSQRRVDLVPCGAQHSGQESAIGWRAYVEGGPVEATQSPAVRTVRNCSVMSANVVECVGYLKVNSSEKPASTCR